MHHPKLLRVFCSSLNSCRELLLALLLIVTSTYSASGQEAPVGKVVRGREIFLAIVSHEVGIRASKGSRPETLRLPDTAELQETFSEGRLGVISAARAGLRALSDEIVDVDIAQVEDVCEEIRTRNPDIDILCEPNYLVQVDQLPDDTYFSSLWGLQKIQAPSAWNVITDSRAVTVAVIDTGIDYTHADLVNNIAVNDREIPGNGIDDDTNGYVDDYYGYDFINYDGDPFDDHYHGTHCAGTVGAQGDNGLGIAGVAWSARLLPVKVLSGSGSGSYAAVTAGINYAVQRGASILSMSLGGPAYSQIMADAITNAQNQGVLVVAAAGNSARDADIYPSYPAAFSHDNIISVAASTSSDGLSSFSNYGVVAVDVAAPGSSIYSTMPGNGYSSLSGTSMAAPHVAGMASLLQALRPDLNYSQIKAALLETVDRLPAFEAKVLAGGRVNLDAAIRSVQISSPTSTPTAVITSTATASPSPSVQPSLTATIPPTQTATATATFTQTSTATVTSTPSIPATNTPAPTATATTIPTRTFTSIPTAAPTLTYTATPQPTNTPVPTEQPIVQPTSAPTAPPVRRYKNRIALSLRILRKQVVFLGAVYNRRMVPVVGEPVTLECRGIAPEEGMTDQRGRFVFRLQDISSRTLCRITDTSGAISKRISVRLKSKRAARVRTRRGR